MGDVSDARDGDGANGRVEEENARRTSEGLARWTISRRRDASRARDRAEARGRATAARRFRPRVSFSGLRVLASGGSSRDDDDAHLLRAVLRVPLRGLVLRVHRGADDETRGGADD